MNAVDISEHQDVAPPADGYFIRVLNEYGREDFRWRDHHSRTVGKPRGAYAIISPEAYQRQHNNGLYTDPVEYARRYVGLLRAAPWELIPSVDVELGDYSAAAEYARVVVAELRKAGFPLVMGYYSALSSYRTLAAPYFDRHWLAWWNHAYPEGAHVHQYTNTPYDQNTVLDWAPIRLLPPSIPVTTFGLLRDTQAGKSYLLGPGHGHEVSAEDFGALQLAYGGPFDVPTGLHVIQWAFRLKAWDFERNALRDAGTPGPPGPAGPAGPAGPQGPAGDVTGVEIQGTFTGRAV